ncbi:MAG: hypothetical protein IT292_05365 [Deltaproteobacteria bacterium]|nr:hypothetical protein [Deltaproteobacteria bacterium]
MKNGLMDLMWKVSDTRCKPCNKIFKQGELRSAQEVGDLVIADKPSRKSKSLPSRKELYHVPQRSPFWSYLLKGETGERSKLSLKWKESNLLEVSIQQCYRQKPYYPDRPYTTPNHPTLVHRIVL